MNLHAAFSDDVLGRFLSVICDTVLTDKDNVRQQWFTPVSHEVVWVDSVGVQQKWTQTDKNELKDGNLLSAMLTAIELVVQFGLSDLFALTLASRPKPVVCTFSEEGCFSSFYTAASVY